MTARWIQALVAGLGLLGILGCTRQADELRAVRASLDSLKVTLKGVELVTESQPTTVTYQLSDVGRSLKVVGMIQSDVPLSKGDRIFLGDDIWDVGYVKLYTEPTSKSGDVQWYRSESVELLVTFGGKGKDRPSTTN